MPQTQTCNTHRNTDLGYSYKDSLIILIQTQTYSTHTSTDL